MIYDSNQNITWLQDANYAMTSGHDDDGQMNWFDASSWADSLVFGGYDDWRLASNNGDHVCSFGSTCGLNVDPGTSEMAYMWYSILGNSFPSDLDPFFDTIPISSSADGVDILNLQLGWYWSGTQYAVFTDNARVYDMRNGFQGTWIKDADSFAWAVRDGDIGSHNVPEPGILLLLAVRPGRGCSPETTRLLIESARTD